MTSTINSRNQICKMNIQFQSISRKKDIDQLTINAVPTENNQTSLGIVYFQSGEGTISNENHFLSCQAHQCCFLDLTADHEIKTTANGSQALILVFSLNAAFADFTFNQVMRPKSTHLESYLNEIYQEFHAGDYVLCQLLTELITTKYINQFNLQASYDSEQSLSARKVSKAKDYIHSHYDEKINLALLAEITDVNRFYLVHMFKEHTGMSPIEYLISFRVDQAKYLLQHSNLTIAKIADTVGFSSQSYFSKTFKRYTQTNPSNFRKNHNKH
ncbi:helix-turn-helix transcriptional regulator [Aerococcus kribbianus]|uniref:AraC family transcriptional regulator n=1 Tax=Aerococcus kribbianus TaxID=2999064 RepID=A0A9X3FM76_9LACT|nr:MULTISPECIES: AraC family transcriptional regulator [unclassified Aerococcus]MCZ0716950.1 AraC family transcriptional regulator [Aerococcus sp. YH-aer221]MCZ0725238.1 AraC family transcriptional regulator [Aerococcus sp. YH-aer222]